MTQHRHFADSFSLDSSVSDAEASSSVAVAETPVGRRFRTDPTATANGRHARLANEQRPTVVHIPRHAGTVRPHLASRRTLAAPEPAVAPPVAAVPAPPARFRIGIATPTPPPTASHPAPSSVRWSDAGGRSRVARPSLVSRRGLTAFVAPTIETVLPPVALAPALDRGRSNEHLDTDPLDSDDSNIIALPSLRDALAAKSASGNPWWKNMVAGPGERQLAWHLPPRMLAAASVAAIIGIAATQLPLNPSTPQSSQLAAAVVSNDGTIAPDRSDTEALQTASRSFIRASVATPSTAAPTTTTTAQAPTTTTTAAPPKKTTTATNVAVPNNYAKCSTSKQAAKDCWWAIIDQYNWDTQTAFNVMWCESTGNPNARNPRSTATGLFQILGGPTDPLANIKQAHDMWSKRGWQPWVCKG